MIISVAASSDKSEASEGGIAPPVACSVFREVLEDPTSPIPTLDELEVRSPRLCRLSLSVADYLIALPVIPFRLSASSTSPNPSAFSQSTASSTRTRFDCRTRSSPRRRGRERLPCASRVTLRTGTRSRLSSFRRIGRLRRLSRVLPTRPD